MMPWDGPDWGTVRRAFLNGYQIEVGSALDHKIKRELLGYVDEYQVNISQSLLDYFINSKKAEFVNHPWMQN
jgi:hypothetical protein